MSIPSAGSREPPTTAGSRTAQSLRPDGKDEHKEMPPCSDVSAHRWRSVWRRCGLVPSRQTEQRPINAVAAIDPGHTIPRTLTLADTGGAVTGTRFHVSASVVTRATVITHPAGTTTLGGATLVIAPAGVLGFPSGETEAMAGENGDPDRIGVTGVPGLMGEAGGPIEAAAGSGPSRRG